MPDKDITTPKTAELEQKTKAQFLKSRVGSPFFNIDGMKLKAPPPGTFATYREMNNNPTTALARAVAKIPIRKASVAVMSQDDVPEDRILFIDRMQKRHWPRLVRDMLWALEFGFSPFEKVFEKRDGLIGYHRIKPLLPDITTIMVDEDTGAFNGFKQGDIQLSAAKSFIFVNEMEGDNWYGTSRHEAIREDAWAPWKQLSKRVQQFAKKAAAIIPMVTYPPGQSPDANGSLQSNFDLAMALIRDLFNAEGIAIPSDLEKFADDIARSGFDPEKWRQWDIKFVEVIGQHAAELVAAMKHLESLMMRGWLIPERSAIEGSFGTKAEAETHGILALVIADLVLQDILMTVNDGLINPILFMNWGEEAVGTIWLQSEGLDPLTKEFFRAITLKILTEKENILLFSDTIDFDTLLEEVGLPKKTENIDSDSATSTLSKQMADLLRKEYGDIYGKSRSNGKGARDRRGALTS